MNWRLTPLYLAVAATFIYLLHPTNPKAEYRQMISEHPFSNRNLSLQDLESIPKRDRPDLAWEQDYLATVDPVLGRPAPERLHAVYQQINAQRQQLMSTPGASGTPWVERGPDNVGGRTRTIMYDPNDPTNKKVWAGGVTGGLWYNNDITNPASDWVAVNDFWDNIAVTCMAYDPTNTNIFYVGTGEGWGTAASRGAGVWKTTDGGSTWTQLPASTGFYYCNDLMVRDEGGTGVLYVAIRGNFYQGSWHGSSSQGLQRSLNGGTSFTQVMPNIPGESFNYAVADIEIAKDNRIWVGTQDASYGGTDRGGGRVLYSDNGTTWTSSYNSSSGDRVEIACAPSDSAYVYAMIEVSSQIGEMKVTTNQGASWTNMTEPNDADGGIPSTDFSRGQAWYDMIIAVHPTTPTTVFTGAIDLFRSTNTGSSWTQISHWYGGFGYPYVHADQHQMVFNPSNPNELLFGHDGGLTRTTNPTAASPTFESLNRGYNVTQFYACAIHPTAGSVYALAGTQDNGTQQFNNAGLGSTVEATGGDGAFCFIDQTNPNIQITSYVYNSYWLSTNGGVSFQNPRFINDQSTGRFINPADYDDNQDALYSARTSTTLLRATNVSSSPVVGNITISGMSDMASHIRVSPYTTTSTTLFVGTGSGDLFKVTNADGSPSSTSIGSSLPAGNISCVEIGASENELIVTLSNYGSTSVWYTSNGGTSWTSKEGNLPDMPVRWALFNPNNRNEVILATEVGVWETSNFNAASPSWSSSNSGLANVRVDMLQIRDSDHEVIAATHGRGLFTSNGFQQPSVPVAKFGASETVVCVGDAVAMVDSSTGVPTSYSWSITPNTFTYQNGTGASSPNPEVSFTATGTYTISLTVSNANGMDTETRTNYIQVGGLGLPFTEDFESDIDIWSVLNPDGGQTWTFSNVGGNTPGSQAIKVDNYSYNSAGARDGLITPPLDFSGYTSVTLDFEYAYRRYSSTYQDSMAVYISTDCGSTWTRIASYQENGSQNYATGSDITSAFVPSTSGDWCGTSPACPSLNLDAYAGMGDVKIMFENICGYGNNLYIDNVNISGTVSVAPTADFTASSTTGCQNTTVTFTDVSANSPTGWTWAITPNVGFTYVNGTNANSQNPQIQFSQARTYDVSLTASNGVGSDVESKTGLIQIDSTYSPSVSIVASTNNICAGSMVTFTATPTNGGMAPTYQWKLNGANVGTNSATFTSSTLANNDSVWVEMSSSLTCVDQATVSSSSGVKMVVNANGNPAVSIAGSSTAICAGDLVTFTATPTDGGSTPSYQWKVNGANVGMNSATYASSTLAQGDMVSVEMTTSLTCSSAPTATSNSVTMTVSPVVTPSVGVTVPGAVTNICEGASVLFSAIPSNGGTSPVYDWYVNGTYDGSGATYSFNEPAGVYNVMVVMQSSLTCVSKASDSASYPSLTVFSLPQTSINTSIPLNPLCAGDSLQLSATPAGGTFSGAGVSGNVFYASSVSTGIHDIYYEYTSPQGCVGQDTIQVETEILPTPTISYNNGVLTCAQSGFSYQWFDANGPINGETNQIFTVFQNGTYYVRISGNWCYAESDTIQVTGINLEEWTTVQSIQLYPTPASDKLNVRINSLENQDVELSVTDMRGRVIHRSSERVNRGENQLVLPTASWAQGAYLLRVVGANGHFNQSFEVVR
ncbi:PKD domain-containing protein [Phaeocystidibacter luteus]|uniref:PKD domain-containing protein n=1 Tax=Phaeocystidibacter luteus TaxID=911197 RepID=A0A6N6RKM6_9FLAO|nr:PKD domain-containing protein [Phaeocystidibacter luteus]KAB2807754.1 PKD domain-containing protein [Phaeocystidibacter luteus]